MSSSGRRDALIGKFRAGALDRLRRIVALLSEIESGRGTAERARDLARDFHTLKGEARMLGFETLSALVHAAEDLVGGKDASRMPSPAICARVLAEIEVLGRWLRNEFPPDEAEAALRAALARLQPASPESTAAAPAKTRAPAVPVATTETTKETATAAPAAAPEVRALPERDAAWMQVRTSRVDDLCEQLAGLSAELRRLKARMRTNDRIAEDREVIEDADRLTARLEEVTAEAWELRLIAVEPQLQDLANHARSLARAQGKQVRVVVRATAEMERAILDEVSEPLLHLIRNAVDHGLEPAAERGAKASVGLLEITAEAVGANVVFVVHDDGRGLDAAAVRDAAVQRGILTPERAAALPEREVFDLVFLQGLSTRASVTDVSGRGVGLDVVRNRAEALGGTVRIDSERGAGSTFTLSIPARIAKEPALVVEAGGLGWAVPSRQIVEVVRLEPDALFPIAGGVATKYLDQTILVHSLAEILGFAVDAEPWMIVADVSGRRAGLLVPRLLGERVLVRHSFDPVLGAAIQHPASAVLDDGTLVVILQLQDLLRRVQRRTGAKAAGAAAPQRRATRILVVDDSPMVLEIVADILGRAGYDVATALNGEQALVEIQREVPALVISDIDMPVMNGFELLGRIRARFERVPVIMLTTRASAEDRQTAASLGAEAYLVKSDFGDRTLTETVRRYVEGAA